MKSFRYLSEAEEELENAHAISRDPDAFLKEVQREIDDICSGMIVHRKVGRGEIRECMMPRLPYLIVYQDETDSITIVAFAHKKRRRGYWKGRLKKS